MNKKLLIWLGIGAAVAVAAYLIMKDKNTPEAPVNHSFTGIVNRDGSELFLNADGNLQALKAKMNKGEKVHIFAQADGMFKVDCDGIWISQDCVTIDREFRNFTGERLEPVQDLLDVRIY